jgi:osmoprotectant transport system ATP-binding protein
MQSRSPAAAGFRPPPASAKIHGRVASIRFESVTKRFPGAAGAAVDGVSLEVPAGAFVVLLGPSGCGKTTLLKTVNRLVEPTSGSVLLDGVDVARIDPTTLRRGIGYVIQHVGLFPHMTVAQNVGVVPRLLGWPRARIEARVDELLELVELPAAEFRRRFPSQLSGGQAQRVGLARALAAEPRVLLMDEPFGAIDAITRAGLQEEMLRLKRALRQTVLFVTHDVEEALRLADRVAVLRAGRVAQYGEPLATLAAPADDFVRDLLGADDALRRLSLMRVSSVASADAGPPEVGAPALSSDQSLRDALSLLLRSGASSLPVVEDGREVGSVSLGAVREAASRKGDA